MDALKTAKTLVMYSSSIGAGLMVGSALRTYVPKSDNPIIRGCQFMGAFSIAGLASEAAFKYSGEQFDGIVALITKTNIVTPKKN